MAYFLNNDELNEVFNGAYPVHQEKNDTYSGLKETFGEQIVQTNPNFQEALLSVLKEKIKDQANTYNMDDIIRLVNNDYFPGSHIYLNTYFNQSYPNVSERNELYFSLIKTFGKVKVETDKDFQNDLLTVLSSTTHDIDNTYDINDIIELVITEQNKRRLGGRRRYQKRPTTRRLRRRSSKARKARKARTTRRKY
jgi:hypothetical protein